MLKQIISIWTAFVMTVVSFAPTAAPTTEGETNAYPCVFVHGFLGWGSDEGINEDIPYWGATACDLIENLNAMGYECYAASVGPISVNWDRVCEFYAQLTGTRVDYGEAHSKTHGHARYGRTYDKPLFEGWGQPDSSGKTKKVNLIGHSLGGNTVRQLLGLLADGSQEEINATDPDELSGLFTGGKSDWVNAVVTVCSPNNGCSLYYFCTQFNLIKPVKIIMFSWARMWGHNNLAHGYFDFHLEHFGLTDVPGEEFTSDMSLATLIKIIRDEDGWVEPSLSPEGVSEMNESVGICNDVYYFAYPFSSTVENKTTGRYTPIKTTLPVLRLFSYAMGSMYRNTISDYQIDEKWFDNDGLVNVISQKAPFDDPSQDYDPNDIKPGVWNVMPVSRGDHGNAIGLGTSEKAVMSFYCDMLDMLNALPTT